MKRKRQAAFRMRRWPGLGWNLLAVAFFLLLFLHTWLRVEPSLRYHHAAPVFLQDDSFLRPFLVYPGGPVDYAAAFLAQLNQVDWLGALVFTGLGAFLFLGAGSLLKRATGRSAPVAALGPVFLLSWLQNSYDFPVGAVGLGLLSALGLAAAYAAQPWDEPWLRLIACWLGAASLLYLAGVWPCLLFAALCGGAELAGWRRYGLGFGCLLSVLLVPMWKFCFSSSGPAAVLKLPGEGWLLRGTVVLYLFVPVAMLVLGGSSKARARATGAAHGPKRDFPPGHFLHARWVKRIYEVSCVGWFLLAGVLVWRTFDLQQQQLVRIGYYADREQWAEVLTAGSRVEKVNSASEINIVRALYHAGRLPEELFSFPWRTDFELLPGLSAGLESCRAQSQTLLELGQVNAAEHFAHEALENEGERPEILRLLARINVLKNRPEAARVFLRVLEKVPFQRSWAKAALRRLESSPAWSDDRDLAEIRMRMVTTDQPGSAISAEALLAQLLHSHPRNRMAFEYLMAHWLLTLQIDQVVTGLPGLADFGYVGIPRHYEEAFLLHQQLQGGSAEDPPGQRIRPETRRRFAQYLERIGHGSLGTLEGRQALLRDFGDTYWLYYLSRSASRERTAAPGAKP